ncbi:MAG: diaminopimelate epimerase [Halobacteriota archaeon]|nr:diaminopimelate epimerase [Halobacteriota archaeon]
MIRFTKMHGNGNDFVIIDEFEDIVVLNREKPDFSKNYCDRNFGIGADGIIFLQPSKTADIRMRLFQPDGSEAEMCGNGIRCLSKYAIDEGYVKSGSFTVETLSGVLSIESKINDGIWIEVNMGRPGFMGSEIPADCKEEFVEKTIGEYKVYAVNTGVPHAVIFLSDLDISIEKEAPKIRYDKFFPEGANVNFAVVNGSEIRIRTYERGLESESLSCGTGSVACVVIAKRLDLVKGDRIKVVTPGGNLFISESNGDVFMEGTAKTVYDGIIR